jgi:hypothetical protein
VSADLTARAEHEENELARHASALASQTQKFAAHLIRREPVEKTAQAIVRNALNVLRLAVRVEVLRALAGIKPRFTNPKDKT